jgi:hypothetical protein
MSRIPGQVTPGAANRKTGDDRSTMAMGPWRKSAAVTGLHQLESELGRVGVVKAAAHHDRALEETPANGARGDFGLKRERGLGPFGEAQKIVGPDARAERVGHQITHQELAGVGFGRGDAALAAGANQKQMLGETGQSAARLIGDPDGQRALFSRAIEHQIRVGGFAGLRNRHDHGSG